MDGLLSVTNALVVNVNDAAESRLRSWWRKDGRAMRLRVLALLMTGALMAGTAAAQTETGRVSGTVTDDQGGVLPGSTVTLKNVGAGTTRSTVTDTNGSFLFANVAPTTYEVTVELQGF